ncbi:MAG: hypothetical protein ACPGGE_03665, partial [Poseidonia sp.]
RWRRVSWKMMSRGEQSAAVPSAYIKKGGLQLADGQDTLNRRWGGEVNHLGSVDGLRMRFQRCLQ